MWTFTLAEYIRRKLWFRAECPACGFSRYMDPRELVTKYDGERTTRPDLIAFRCRCGRQGQLVIAPVCMLEFRPPRRVEHLTMERLESWDGVLCIVCLRCKQEKRISPAEWQDAGHDMERPLGTWRYLCQRCILITGKHQPVRLELRYNYKNPHTPQGMICSFPLYPPPEPGVVITPQHPGKRRRR